MVKFRLGALGLLLCMSLTALAQQGNIGAFSGTAPSERATTRIVYFDNAKKALIGEVAIHFGQPVWKKEYESPMFDTMTKGKVWRFGKDFWTTLDTNVPIKIAGKDVQPGAWYLGLHRSDDGSTWSLAFLDQAKVRAAKLDAFAAAQAPVEFKIPMKTEKAETSTDKLVILLTAPKDKPTEATLTVQWGSIKLSAPVMVTL
jgi:hypothetical protein